MYSFIDSNEWATEAIRELVAGKDYALDTETSGLDPYTSKLLLIQVATDDKVVIFDARKIDKDVMHRYLDHLINLSGKLVIFNAKFDLKFLIHNYKLEVPTGKIYDPMLMEVLLYNGVGKQFYALKDLLEKYFSITVDKDIRQDFVDYNEDNFSDELLEYAAKDVLNLIDLASAQQYYLAKNGLEKIAELENNLTVPIADMELRGVQLDTKKWLDVYKENTQLQSDQLSKIREMVGGQVCEYLNKKNGKTTVYNFAEQEYNPRSYMQTIAIVNSRIEDKKQMVDSSDSKILAKLNIDVADEIIKFRELGKLTSSYGLNILELINPVTGRIHCDFHQLGAQSGRFSSANPNLQNIPVRRGPQFRSCFVAPEGYVFIDTDYSQIEYRLAGEISDDELVIRSFIDGTDLHTLSASIMFKVPFDQVTKEQRYTAKTFNFSVLYGASAYRVSREFKISLGESETLITNWKRGFPRLSDWLSYTENFVLENGYVETLWGRRRYWELPSSRELNSKDREISKKAFSKKSKIVREACNMPIQGTSADMTKMGIINAYYKIKDYDAFNVLTVHDEILSQVREEYAEDIKNLIVNEMIKAGQLFLKKVPVKVGAEISKVWEH